MSKTTILGILGGCLLILGAFVTAISGGITLWEGKSFLQYFPVTGVLLIGLAIASFVLIFWNKTTKLLYVSGAVFVLLIATHLYNQHQKSERVNRGYNHAISMSGNKRELATDLARTMELFENTEKYGVAWTVSIIGGLLVLTPLLGEPQIQKWFASNFALSEPPTKRCPICAGVNVAEAVRCQHCGESIG